MNDEAYCYPNFQVLCGECGWMMDGSTVSDHSVRPFKYRVMCTNESCRHHGIIYDMEGAKIVLKPAAKL